ncbi:MAG: glycolate oxidase iron-sulfur subunit [Rhodospirillaceae bacterium]|nr:glycolate oxidase iron-sulfur subunit [Rhodospirillaceae bacterium]
MQTNFTLAQLADPEIQASEGILRSCVHCGFCTATCPTYVLLGDELDSPRGRIYLIKDMLENNRPAGAQVAKHIDRCLSCLACMTTCPSGVHYMHLIDSARKRVEDTFHRPLLDRFLRAVLALVLPSPNLFRLALVGAQFMKPFAPLVRKWLGGAVGAMLTLAPSAIHPPSPFDRPQTFPTAGRMRARMALMTGCAQQVLSPSINEATVRLLTRQGVEVLIAKGAGCCGSLQHHMGKGSPSLSAARANIDAWYSEAVSGGLDAVVINASGCGTTVKDYGWMLREDPAYATKAAHISSITRDITEVIKELGLGEPLVEPGRAVTYHSACSMQHGQQITTLPQALLRSAGFIVSDVPEGHLCCGSAGTYNILQSGISEHLKERKLANIRSTRPEIIAAGNIGCIVQLATASDVPVVHTVELLDWATGGPMPEALVSHRDPRSR